MTDEMTEPAAPITGPAAPPRWPQGSEWDLAGRQLRAIAAFHHARAIAAWATAAGARSRNMRQQDARRLEVLRRQHEAVVRRAHEQLGLTGVARRERPPRRVVLAHPRQSLLDEIGRALEEQGLAVVGQVDNGADAVGIVLVEQPDVVLVGDPLAMVDAVDVVRQVREYSPGTLVVARAAEQAQVAALSLAGATAVLAARLPAVDVVARLVTAVGPELPPATAD